MRAFTEQQALSALAEDVVDNDEDDLVKEYLDNTLCTGQRLSCYGKNLLLLCSNHFLQI